MILFRYKQITNIDSVRSESITDSYECDMSAIEFTIRNDLVGTKNTTPIMSKICI
jgi:hypothetical protein